MGAVITDSYDRIISTGRNGAPPGVAHCIQNPCKGASLPSGTGLDQCEAIHAEINALLWCPDITRAVTLYVTVTPCVSCVKALLAAPNLKRIVATALYPHPSAIETWTAAGRTIDIVGRLATMEERYGPMRNFIKASLNAG